MSNYEKYLTSFNGGIVTKKHSLSDFGLWEVRGESEHDGVHGSYTLPLLGYFQGTLQNVLMYVVELDKFWTYGSGGEIKAIDNIINVTPDMVKQKKDLEHRRDQLRKDLEEIESNIENLGKPKTPAGTKGFARI